MARSSFCRNSLNFVKLQASLKLTLIKEKQVQKSFSDRFSIRRHDGDLKYFLPVIHSIASQSAPHSVI